MKLKAVVVILPAGARLRLVPLFPQLRRTLFRDAKPGTLSVSC
jgi:hypothetical protein